MEWECDIPTNPNKPCINERRVLFAVCDITADGQWSDCYRTDKSEGLVPVFNGTMKFVSGNGDEDETNDLFYTDLLSNITQICKNVHINGDDKIVYDRVTTIGNDLPPTLIHFDYSNGPGGNPRYLLWPKRYVSAKYDFDGKPNFPMGWECFSANKRTNVEHRTSNIEL